MALLVAAMLVMQLTPAAPASAADEATLTQDVTPENPPYNGNLAVSSVAPFDVDGGTASFRPGTDSEEEFTYTGVDAETLILTGVRREVPESHPNGSTVAPVEPSPASSPSPGGEAASPSPSPATDDAGAPSSPSTATDETSSEPASADFGTDGSSELGVAEIPPPCELLGTCEIDPGIGCQGCDELVDQLVGLIDSCQLSDCIAPVNDLIVRICGGRDVLGCQTKLTEVIGVTVGEVCPSGLTTCADPTINMISRLVMDTICPSGSIGYCAGEIARQVNEKVAFAVGIARGLVVLACTGDTADNCIQTVQALLDSWVFQTVCGSSNLFTCTNNLADDINDLAASACSFQKALAPPTDDSATTRCVDRVYQTVEVVLGVVDDAMIVACQSTDANSCAANLIERVNATVGTACSFVPGMSVAPGATRCVDRVLGLVDTVVDVAEQRIQQTCGSTDPRRCVEMATGEAFEALDAVNDLVANTCKQSIGATTSTGDSAVTNCVDRTLATAAAVQQLAIKTANDAMIVACQSTDANSCAANLIERVNATVGTACSFVPGMSVAPGATRCVDRVLGLVDTVVDVAEQRIQQTCGSTDPRRCVEMATGEAFEALDAVNDLVANTCKQSIGATTSTGDSAVTNCVDRTLATAAAVQQLAIKTANDAMVAACGSTDANACLGNLITRVNVEVTRICTSVPGGSYANGVSRCTDRAVQIVNDMVETAELAMERTCGSRDVVVCAENFVDEVFVGLDTVNDLLANTCKQNLGGTTSTGDSAVTNCVDRVLSVVAAAQELAKEQMRDHCGSSEAAACLSNVLVEVNDQITRTCGTVPGTSSSTGAQVCIDRLLKVVESVIAAVGDAMEQSCGSTEATACGENVLNQVLRAMASVDRAGAEVCAPGSSSPSAPEACTARLLETIDLVVRWTCGSADPATCLQNVLNGLDEALELACGAIPGPAVPANPSLSGVSQSCAGKVLGAVDTLVKAACHKDGLEACADDLFIDLSEALKSLCDGAYTRCDDVVIATASYLVGVGYDLVCPDQPSEATCVEGYEALVSPIIEAAQVTLYQSVCPMAPALSDCTAAYQALLRGLLDSIIDTIMTTVCPFDPSAPACVERLKAALALMADDLAGAGCPGGVEGCVDDYIERFEPRPQDCELGDPPYHAEDLPPVIPPVCGALLIGQAVLDSGIGAEIPDRGLGVSAHAMTQEGALSFGINTDVTGAIYFENVGNELLTGGAPAEGPEPTPTPTATPGPSSAPSPTPGPSGGPTQTPAPSTAPTQPPTTTTPTSTPSAAPTSTPPAGASPTPPPSTPPSSTPPASTPPSSTPPASTPPSPTPSPAQSEPADLDEDVKAAKGGGGGSPSPCRDDRSVLLYDRERGIDPPIEWRFNRQSVPEYLGDKDQVLEQIKHGGINWAHVYTNCDDFPSIELPKLFDFLGVNNEASANMKFVQNEGWVCQDDGDDLNIVVFGPLERGVLASACHWHAGDNNPNRKMIESDIRINESKGEAPFYAQGSRPDDCHQNEPGFRYDLQGVMTHERGHTLGLADLSYANHAYLTMAGKSTECVRWDRTLGRGDFIGLKRMYAK